MEALRKTLELIFLKEDPDKVLKAGCLPTNFCRRETVLSSREIFHALTLDQLETVLRQVDGVWMQKGDFNMNKYVEGRPSVFNVLLNFSNEVMSPSSKNPVVKYDSLLRWHDVTSLLTEDLFTTSYLASKDIAFRRGRSRFDWKPCIDHDNTALNNIFSKPMAELHSHLKGASLNFELNWLSLMNQPWHRDEAFSTFLISQRPSPHVILGENIQQSMYSWVIKAAAIRLLIFLRQMGITSLNQEGLLSLIYASSLKEQKLYLDSIRREIGTVKYLHSKRFATHEIDYTITNSCCADSDLMPFSILTGERAFMYRAFRDIFEYDTEKLQDLLFYAYLLIKNRFRQELMQTNSYKGFANFGIYERRKEGFIPEEGSYANLVQAEAVSSFFSGKASDSYLEVRITPKDSIFALDSSIKYLVETIGETVKMSKHEKQQYRFILHFIKERDVFKNGPRHRSLRASVMRSSISLIRWRNFEFNMNADRIVGIDAANSELHCRPEVFAQAYRFCRHHSWNRLNQNPNELHFTYHVGEDFYDVIDGLRAVWEAIHFLGLTRGDRIGHGLVLGTEVRSYYATRRGLVYLPKQVLLDNVVWLLHEGDFQGRVDNLYRDLTNLYQSLVLEIYGYKPLLDDYFQSLCLRGDSPDSHNITARPVTQWNQLDENDDSLAVIARRNKEAIHLFRQYHYNRAVVSRGDIVREFKVENELIKVIQNTQLRMLHLIEDMGIAIETNPTSNIKIGHMSTYNSHPLMEFNNVGLKVSGQYRGISVSINTDDRGVFGTSLEREFSLVAAALEKQYKKGEGDTPPRLIYDWLDKIRQMAFEQRFVGSI